MTVLKIKNRPVNGHFNSFVDDFFNQFPSMFRGDHSLTSGNRTVPVNIRETETAYLLDVVAPGLNKEDFKISLENNLLSISFEKKSESDETKEKFIRSEYQFSSFTRSFTIDEKISADEISAQYVNGVLTLNLPKKAVVKPSAKQITIE
jgi:HSP20 family protein